MTTYAQLQLDFARYIKRTDLPQSLPGYVALFEARAGRRLRLRQQETAFSGTTDSLQRIALPSNWVAFKVLTADADRRTLKAQSLAAVLSSRRYPGGTPTLYAIDGDNVRFDGVGSISGVYYARLPGLVAAGATWLSAAAYDAYLFGTLAEAHVDAHDEDRAQLYSARADAALQELMSNDMRDRFSGPFVSRQR
jgi:hypothetical protein